ncbi:hypothetical protein ACFL96_08310 [Thermoproteota archaeon]
MLNVLTEATTTHAFRKEDGDSSIWPNALAVPVDQSKHDDLAARIKEIRSGSGYFVKHKPETGVNTIDSEVDYKDFSDRIDQDGIGVILFKSEKGHVFFIRSDIKSNIPDNQLNIMYNLMTQRKNKDGIRSTDIPVYGGINFDYLKQMHNQFSEMRLEQQIEWIDSFKVDFTDPRYATQVSGDLLNGEAKNQITYIMLGMMISKIILDQEPENIQAERFLASTSKIAMKDEYYSPQLLNKMFKKYMFENINQTSKDLLPYNS